MIKKRHLYEVLQTEVSRVINGKIKETYDLYTRGQFENKQDALNLFEELKDTKPTKNNTTYTIIEDILEYWDETYEEWLFVNSEILDSCLYTGVEEEEQDYE